MLWVLGGLAFGVVVGYYIPFTYSMDYSIYMSVAILAIMDSILGALALGDIGKHFPDTDEEYKGVDSMKLLEHVYNLITSKGYKIGNIDSTIIAQSPKMAPYIESMRSNISKVLNTDIDNINIKATTEEGLGFTGAKQGIASQSICLLLLTSQNN